MLRGINGLVRLFSSGKKSKINVQLLPGPINAAANTKYYQIISLM